MTDFAKAHSGTDEPSSTEAEMQSGMKEMMSHIRQQQADDDKACECRGGASCCEITVLEYKTILLLPHV